MNRLDIIDAHQLYMTDWHSGGLTKRDCAPERAHLIQSATRSRSACILLHRIGYRPHSNLSLDTLSEEARDAYAQIVEKWEGPICRLSRYTWTGADTLLCPGHDLKPPDLVFVADELYSVTEVEGKRIRLSRKRTAP